MTSGQVYGKFGGDFLTFGKGLAKKVDEVDDLHSNQLLKQFRS